jgi:hypothetical protein
MCLVQIKFTITLLCLATGALSCGSGCASYPRSRTALVARGYEAIRDNSAGTFKSMMLDMNAIKARCPSSVTERLKHILPARQAKVPGSIKACHRLTNWDQIHLLGISGGDEDERPKECGGFYKRLTDIVVTYAARGKQVTVRYRRPYRASDGSMLVGKAPYCSNR